MDQLKNKSWLIDPETRQAPAMMAGVSIMVVRGGHYGAHGSLQGALEETMEF